MNSGKLLAIYNANNEWYKIESIQDGYVYFFNIEGDYYGVVLSDVDNKDSIKERYTKNKKELEIYSKLLKMMEETSCVYMNLQEKMDMIVHLL